MKNNKNLEKNKIKLTKVDMLFFFLITPLTILANTTNNPGGFTFLNKFIQLGQYILFVFSAFFTAWAGIMFIIALINMNSNGDWGQIVKYLGILALGLLLAYNTNPLAAQLGGNIIEQVSMQYNYMAYLIV